MKPENYITIQGWMRTELNLSGNELILYALIYGFSQADHNKFTGGMQYAADWLGCSRQTIINTLKSLLAKGLITKEDRYINNVKFCDYGVVKNLYGVSNNLTEVVKNLDGGESNNFTGVVKNLDTINKEIIKKDINNHNPLLPDVEEIKQRVAVMKQESTEHYERMQGVR